MKIKLSPYEKALNALDAIEADDVITYDLMRLEVLKDLVRKVVEPLAERAWYAGYGRGIDTPDGDDEFHPTKEEFLKGLLKELK